MGCGGAGDGAGGGARQRRPRGRGGGPARGRARAPGRAAAAVGCGARRTSPPCRAVDQYRDQAQRAERGGGGARQALAVAKSGSSSFRRRCPTLGAGARDAARTASLAAEREVDRLPVQRSPRPSCARARRAPHSNVGASVRAALERGLARAAERQAAHARRSQGLARCRSRCGRRGPAVGAGGGGAGACGCRRVLDTAREALASAEQPRADAARGPTRPAALRRRARGRDPRAGKPRAGSGDGRSARPSRGAGRPDHRTGSGAGRRPARRHRARAPTATGCEPGAELPPPRLPEGATPLLRPGRRAGAAASRGSRASGSSSRARRRPLQSQLLPGHRLVSRDGGLWRWDGFVRAPGGEDPAVARVRHRLRLHAAREELAALGQDLVASEASAGACELAVQAARAALAEAEVRWRAADTAQLRARQRVDEGLALAERRAAELTQLDEEAAALARDLAELERERLELVAAGEPGDEAATAAAEEAAARSALGEAERRLAAAEAEAGRAEAAWLATAARRPGAGGGRPSGRPCELEQARLVAGADARAAAEQEAERRARAGALERELAELGDGAGRGRAGGDCRGSAGPGSGQTEQMAAEAALATAEAARRQAAEALMAARGEAAALARRLEDIEREPSRGRACGASRRRPCWLSCGSGCSAWRASSAWRRRASDRIRRGWRNSRPGWLRRKRRQRRRATSWLAGRPWRRAWRPSWRRRMRRWPVCASGWRWRSPSAAMPTRRWPPPWPRCATGCSRSRWPCWRTRRPGPRWRRPASRSSMPGSRGCGRRATGWGRSTCGPRSRPASSRPPWPRPGRARPSCSRRWTGCGPAIGTLDGEARQRLLAAFEAVDGHFRRLFAVLFGGGKAHLRLDRRRRPAPGRSGAGGEPAGQEALQHLAAVGRREDADRAGAGLRLLPGAALALVRAGRGRRAAGRRQCRPVRGADAGDRPGQRARGSWWSPTTR